MANGKRKWIGPMMQRAKRKGTVGVFSRKAKSMGISTRALARRWYRKAGVWGKRARAAAHMMGVRGRGRTARGRGGGRTARARTRRTRR